MEAIRYAKRLAGRTEAVSPGVLRRREVELVDRARLESELLFAGDASFREEGTISFAAGSSPHFRTLGTGSVVQSPDPGLRHGVVTWELDGGAAGGLSTPRGGSHRPSRSPTTERGTDEQHGFIFLHDNREEQS